MEVVDWNKWITEPHKTQYELGVRIWVADKLLSRYLEAVREGCELMCDRIAKVSVRDGTFPTLDAIESERDIPLRAYDISLITKQDFSATPERYMAMAFHHWQLENKENERLASLSLWGHIKQWWVHKRGRDEWLT